MSNISQSIRHVLDYFSIFSYPPTKKEVYLFLNVKMTEREFNKTLNELIRKKTVVSNNNRLAYSNSAFSRYEEKEQISQIYYSFALTYLKWLSIFPSIRFIGISGSLSMLNTNKEGDIDLFIVASRQSIWTTRFILLVYKHIVRVINFRMGNKLCFNLFFSEDSLLIENKKRNEYIGHELLQLKSIINKNDTYATLLSQNSWIQLIFPNLHVSLSKNKIRLSNGSKIMESISRKIQIWWLNKKTIKFEEKEGQVWFIQDDFESNLPKVYKVVVKV